MDTIPPMPFRPTATELLLEAVSRLYLVENKSQLEIAGNEQVKRLYEEATGKKPKGITISPATVTRLLQRAQQLGVASISVDASFAVNMEPDPEASKNLRKAFRLQECSVLVAESPEERQDQGDEDRLILGLANATARDINKTLAPSDHVALSGGRTILFLARAIRRKPESKIGLMFSPLSGRLWVEDWQLGPAELIERPLDADDAVHVFAEAFEKEPGGRYSQINYPLYHASRTIAQRILRDHCALRADGGWNWGLPDATRAFVGVGSLGSAGHRLSVFMDRYEHNDPAAQQSSLRVAADALLEIRNDCNDRNMPLPMPGDLGNRLFPCLPFPHTLSNTDKRARSQLAGRIKKIARKIEALNDRAVVMSWEHLRRTPRVLAICGGASKVEPLFTLLLAAYFDGEQALKLESVRPGDRVPRSAQIITALTTDTATAETLLTEMEAVIGDDSLKAWYRDLLQDIGLCIRRH